ncbi:MAG: hypothetical protein ACK4UV_12240, partial [Ignavibacterium sp.]
MEASLWKTESTARVASDDAQVGDCSEALEDSDDEVRSRSHSVFFSSVFFFCHNADMHMILRIPLLPSLCFYLFRFLVLQLLAFIPSLSLSLSLYLSLSLSLFFHSIDPFPLFPRCLPIFHMPPLQRNRKHFEMWRVYVRRRVNASDVSRTFPVAAVPSTSTSSAIDTTTSALPACDSALHNRFLLRTAFGKWRYAYQLLR